MGRERVDWLAQGKGSIGPGLQGSCSFSFRGAHLAPRGALGAPANEGGAQYYAAGSSYSRFKR